MEKLAIHGTWHTPPAARAVVKRLLSPPAAPQAASAATAAAQFEYPRTSAASADSSQLPVAFLQQVIFPRARAPFPGSALSVRWLAPLPTSVCCTKSWPARIQATLFPPPFPCVRATRLTRAASALEF